MKKLFKPACLLFNILMLITFFFVGITYASIIEAGKGQMLASGAIVLGYALVSATVAFIVSFFITYRLKHKLIVNLNIVLALLIIAFFAYYSYQHKADQELKNKEPQISLTSILRTRIA